MISINMLSRADMVKGQGVLSAYNEQVNLVKEEFTDEFKVLENKLKLCEIMHFHTINPEFFFMIPFAKRKGKAVGYVHFLPETLEKSIHLPVILKKIFYKYVITFYKSMDYLVTVNPYFIDVLENYGVDRNKVTYIPNFVDSKSFYPLDCVEVSELRQKYKLDSSKFTVLCVGQLQKRKGIFDFIDIAKRMPEVQFIWAGNFAFGKISDGYEEIKKILDNVPENVCFLGLIDRNKMNEVYNMSDVMFLPSYEELFPMTVLESMNVGLPILLRDIDLYKNILFDFYLKGRENGEFIEIIKKLKTDKDFYNSACERSFEGHQFYSKEHVSRMWKEFYSRVKAN
ncbi:glycosyltransferase family 4 protein [Clostridium sp. SHJSY1]|uniref:glycosyltransferase family 4 protein n=1 Tax=Clostridium sp. SHJSY1 TaxID=2942483 RepID=UPI002876BA44|nr:glycosyltransferase family 4 protein [Clostridium sp. SHJSY1]MDS0526122.1 glycosyltransferase family 4 protein [Clostridium sp. SHJSY1]